MTPEEAPFIEGIAAAPADEALRLVYSDWLEEHGDDARAAYLRAELAHFRTPYDERPENKWAEDGRQEDKWWEMPGVDVDPVWAATVCRAPIGILVPGLTFTETGPKIARADLKAIEDHWGHPLPPDYAAFMLLYNGGRPSKPYLYVSRRDYHADGSETVGRYYAEVRFFALGEKDESGRRYDRTSALELSAGGYIPAHLDDDMDLMMGVGTLTYDPGYGGTMLLTLLLESGEVYNRYNEFEVTAYGLQLIEETYYGTLAKILDSLVERIKKKTRKTKKKPLPPTE
jgi:uncharacterized protein (TIGR02996 family)